MDWADELAAGVSGPQVVNDSKTPSGTVHVGSLRGPVILDVIARALRHAGLETTLLYGVDDLDPMDAQALLTPDAVEREMGRPLAHVPDPAGDCHASYARHFAGIFIETFRGLGIVPDRYYWMSDIYPTGQMDGFIRTALDRAATVRDIYRRVANVQHPDSWLPLSVICPNCGRIGTTFASDWDGETVAIELRAGSRELGDGLRLDAAGSSPFGGAAKLPWNLEWAAQWSLLGVTIEPCGKDLSTAGGSRDRSDAIAREVFEREPPLNVPYEFINIGGKKMSTSKGRGAAAHEIVEVIPPEQLRFFFLRPKPNHAVDFDPEGTDAVPRMFDEFDKFADATAGKRGPRRPAAGLREHVRLLAARPRRGRRDRGGGVPAAVRAPRAARPDPERRRPGAGRGGEGERPDRSRGGDPRRAHPRRPGLARGLRPGAGDRRGPRGSADRGPARPRRRAAPVSRRPGRGRPGADVRRGVAGPDLLGGGRAIGLLERPRVRRDLRRVPRAGRTGRAPAGSWRRLDPEFVIERLRVASGQVPA